MFARLSAVAGMGATHPGLPGDRNDPFRRPAAQGRVRSRFACPGLPPSPGRSGARCSYWSPSSRVWRGCVVGQRTALTVGGRQRVVRIRRAGRLEGERESNSDSIPWCWFITSRPPPA